MRYAAFVSSAITVSLLAALSGCSATGAAWETLRIGQNVAEKDSHLEVYLDGHKAEQNTLKKAYFGYASFKVRQTVSTTPSFKFNFDKDKNFGRITSTSLQIHKEFDADYSHQAEFIITPAHPNDSNTMLKPGETLNLAAPGSNWRVMNFEKQTVSGVKLEPGVDYLMVFTVSGDRSESVQIFFSTK